MRTKASIPISLFGAVALLAVTLALRGLGMSGATEAVAILPAEDAARMGVQVKPIDPTEIGAAGLVTRDQALAAASAQWTDEPEMRDAFLQQMTDPNSTRADEPIVDRAVWVIRYSGLSVISPGDREMHFAYVVIDARTGIEIHTNWAQ